MVTVLIPEPLRKYTEGLAAVSLEAATVADVLLRLATDYEGLGTRLIDETGNLRPGVTIAVDGRDIRFSGRLDTPTPAAAEVQIVVTMLV
jgi:sulfur-carrier protein